MEIRPKITPHITLSDNAIREHEQKLSLIGIFDQLNAQRFLFSQHHFLLLLVLPIFRNNTNEQMHIEEKSSGHVIAGAVGEIGATGNLRPSDAIPVPFHLTGNFPSPGLYSVIVSAESNQIGLRDFMVNPPHNTQGS